MDIDDAKKATQRALEVVADLFGAADLEELALEEIEYDESNDLWLVTVGFFRKWETRSHPLKAVLGSSGSFLPDHLPRRYKVVRIKRSGEVISIKNREDTEA